MPQAFGAGFGPRCGFLKGLGCFLSGFGRDGVGAGFVPGFVAGSSTGAAGASFKILETTLFMGLLLLIDRFFNVIAKQWSILHNFCQQLRG